MIKIVEIFIYIYVILILFFKRLGISLYFSVFNLVYPIVVNYI